MPGPHDYVLEIVRLLDAPREKVFRCWAEAELLKQWFAPSPWTTSVLAWDFRPGGGSNVVMQSPEGEEFPNPGLFLAIEPNRRIVFTDAFAPGWKPAGQPFFVGEVTFEDAPGGKTKYRARAQHWTEAAMQQHEKMGFKDGWSVCAGQLEQLAKSL
jgi:uncharacterized protein YndB with AHSA1/START domain